MAPFEQRTHVTLETASVLCVSREGSATARIADALQQVDERLEVQTANSVETGLDQLREQDIACVVSQYDLPAGNGLTFLEEVRKREAGLPFVLFPSSGSEALASEAITAGVTEYVRNEGSESYEQVAIRVVDVVRDHETKHVKERVKQDARRLLERTVDAFLMLDTDWRFRYVNEAAEREFDRPADELLGNSIWEVAPEATETPFYEHYQGVMAEGEPRTIEEYFEPWNCWYREHLYPSEDGLSVVFHDVTDQKQREQELAKAKAQLESGIAAGGVGTWEWHISEDTFVAGPSFARKFGVDPEAARDGVSIEPFLSAIHKDDRERIEDAIDEAIGTCGEYEEEYRVWNADDELRWVVAQGHVECDEDGDALRFPGALSDITERKRSERELRRHQAFLQESTDIVSVLEADGTIDYVSPSVEKILGYSPEELVGTDGFDRLHPDDRDDLLATFGDLVDGSKTSMRTESRFQDADGDWCWLEMHASNHLETPVIDGIVVNSRDISERKDQQRKHQVTIDRMTEAIVELDEDWTFTEINERAEEMYGKTSEELVGRNIWNVFPERVGTQFYEEYHRVMSTDEPTTFEVHDERLDTWYEVNVYPSLDSGLSIYFRDITELKEREQELKQRHTELAQLNQFNELVQNLVQTLMTESTRTEIEKTVCTQLTDSDLYQGVWIGEQRQPEAVVEPRTSSGIDLAVLQTSTSDRSDGESPPSPSERAAETRSVCIARDTDEDLDSTADTGNTIDVEAVLATPIEYEDVLYGVLVVYTARPDMFDDRQQTIFGDLGETIGFAIAAIERKEALVADTALELTLDIRDENQFFSHTATKLETTVSLEGVVRRDGSPPLEYFSIDESSPSRIRSQVDRFDGLDHIRIVTERESECLVEIQMDQDSIVSTVATLGGSVTEMSAEQRQGTVSVEFPQTTDVSRILEALERTVDTVALQTKRTVDRPVQSEGRFKSTVTDCLTDKQREALEAAYLAGFFEHPRFSTGEEVAESLGISPSTFHQHIRVGLSKLLATLVEETPENRE